MALGVPTYSASGSSGGPRPATPSGPRPGFGYGNQAPPPGNPPGMSTYGAPGPGVAASGQGGPATAYPAYNPNFNPGAQQQSWNNYYAVTNTPANGVPSNGANLIANSLFGGSGPQTAQQQYLLDSIMNLPVQAREQVLTGLQNNPSWQVSEAILSGNIGVAEGSHQMAERRLGEDLMSAFTGTNRSILDMGEDYAAQIEGLNLNRQLLGLEGQGYGQDIGYYNELIGLANQMLGTQMQGYDLTDTTSTRERGTRDRRLRSDAAGRGAFISQGFRDDKTDSAAMLDEALQGTQIGRQQAGISNRQQVAGYENSIADAQRGLARVGINGRQYGLDEANFGRAFERGVRNAGLDLASVNREITRALEDGDIAHLGQVQNYVSEILAMSGFLDNQ